MFSTQTIFRKLVLAAGLGLAAMVVPVVATPAIAAVNNQEPGAFVDTLSDEGFAVLRTGDRAAARTRFRTLLSQYFSVDTIGDRLIRRWRTKITPAQYSAYKAAFPNFIIGTYADRLFDYSRADLKVVRTVPQGTSAAVMTQVTRSGSSPLNAVWTVEKIDGGYKVSNLSVAGINLAVTQAADFDAYIQRNGFDKLIAFMKARG